MSKKDKKIKKLKSSVKVLNDKVEIQKEIIHWQRAENAKLREPIRTVWFAGDFRAFLGVEEIKERMRELGVEVK